MKIRFKRTILVEVAKTKLQETWDKPFNRWDELRVEKIDTQGKVANLTDYNGDVFLSVPTDAYEVVA
jgi:hypothetical protein